MRLTRRGDLFARFTLGRITVTALSDGFGLVFPRELVSERPVDFTGIADAGGNIRLDVNAFLIDRGGLRLLIDAGSANAWEATAGRLCDALAEAGVARDSIDGVAITHCHSDHIQGLVMPDGTVAFPEARRIYVPHEEVGLFRAEARLQPVFDRIRPFRGGDEISPGLTAVAAHGHEVGRTAFLLGGGSEQLLAWGDIVHVPAVQFANPDATWVFDTDQDMARQSRRRLMALVAAENIPVAGTHLAFPGIGMVSATEGGYQYQAVQ